MLLASLGGRSGKRQRNIKCLALADLAVAVVASTGYICGVLTALASTCLILPSSITSSLIKVTAASSSFVMSIKLIPTTPPVTTTDLPSEPSSTRKADKELLSPTPQGRSRASTLTNPDESELRQGSGILYPGPPPSHLPPRSPSPREDGSGEGGSRPKVKIFHIPRSRPLSPSSPSSATFAPATEPRQNGTGLVKYNGNGDTYTDSDAERQPLLSNGASGQRSTLVARVAYPLLIGAALIASLALVVVFGGWRLGQGTGGDRWPGGPH